MSENNREKKDSAPVPGLGRNKNFGGERENISEQENSHIKDDKEWNDSVSVDNDGKGNEKKSSSSKDGQ